MCNLCQLIPDDLNGGLYFKYVALGQIEHALTSLSSDLNKHPAWRGHVGLQLGVHMLMTGDIASPANMRTFIEVFQ